jgi:hypothetical protein
LNLKSVPRQECLRTGDRATVRFAFMQRYRSAVLALPLCILFSWPISAKSVPFQVIFNCCTVDQSCFTRALRLSSAKVPFCLFCDCIREISSLWLFLQSNNFQHFCYFCNYIKTISILVMSTIVSKLSEEKFFLLLCSYNLQHYVYF